MLILFGFLTVQADEYNTEWYDTTDVYMPWFARFIDTTTNDSTWVRAGYIQSPYFKSVFNIDSQLGAYVHGIKVEQTRTANIQPVTSCWFGGQFVLNSGTTAWADINKPAYAVQGIIKGDQWDGVHDVNAARFELQSSGSVRDIVYILANTGTSVSSSMLYMPTHISLPNMIQLNVQSSSTVTNAIDILSGSGSSYNYGIDLGDATINTADFILGNGALIFNKHADSLLITEANVKIIGNLLASTYLNLPVPDSAVVSASAHLADSAIKAVYAWDSDKWDSYQFADYIDQAVKEASDVTFNRLILERTSGGGGWLTLERPDTSFTTGIDFKTTVSGTPFTDWDIYQPQYTRDLAIFYIPGAFWAIYLDTLGYVGIMNNSPTEALDVTGDIKGDTIDFSGTINKAGTKVFDIELDSNSVYIGEDAGHYGTYNLAIGTIAGQNTTGDYNTFIGSNAGQTNVAGHDNFALGFRALEYNVSGNDNVAIGVEALRYNTANYNLAIGANAMKLNNIGTQNVAIGQGALAGDTSASYVVAIGNGAFAVFNAGSAVAIGHNALVANTTGGYNIGIGREVGKTITTGVYNTLMGYRVGYSGGIDPDHNVVIGALAGYELAGDYNTFIGKATGYNITGSYNVCLGNLAGYSLTTVSNQLHIAVSLSDTLIYGEFDNHYVFIKDSLYAPSIVVDNLHGPSPIKIHDDVEILNSYLLINGGDSLEKMVKVGSFLAIIMNSGKDTFYVTNDTTKFQEGF